MQKTMTMMMQMMMMQMMMMQSLIKGGHCYGRMR